MSEIELTHLINSIAAELEDEIIDLRREIHQYPELSFQEFLTSEFIYNKLLEIPNLIISRPTPTSVKAVLKGDLSGKVLAVRSDIDALALQEENELDYKSKNNGVMHACGHDGHAAMLIGTIKILVKLKHLIRGEIHFIFQHAEEKHPGGARELVEQGILNNVDMIISAHLWIALNAGTISLVSGPTMAAPDNFDISIIGKGGHAGIPHETIDPIIISANVVTALQSIVSRQTNPLKPLVISLTRIHGGSTYNIIPEKVDLRGTVRTFDEEIRQSIPNTIENTVKGICSAFQANYSFRYERGYNPVINDHDIITRISKVIDSTIGSECIKPMLPVMGGEDFSAYLSKIPGALIFIGAGNKDKGIDYPHHHPCFNIDESSLTMGMKVLTISALGLLDNNI